jgi:hypothetical protein
VPPPPSVVVYAKGAAGHQPHLVERNGSSGTTCDSRYGQAGIDTYLGYHGTPAGLWIPEQCLVFRAPFMVILDRAGPRGDATVRSSTIAQESRSGRVIDRSAIIIRSQSGSTRLLLSLRHQCRAITSWKRMKYGVGSWVEEKKEENLGLWDKRA